MRFCDGKPSKKTLKIMNHAIFERLAAQNMA